MAASDQIRADDAEKAQTRALLKGVGVGAVVLVGLAVGLWARYGTAVFLDTMATAWAYCF